MATRELTLLPLAGIVPEPAGDGDLVPEGTCALGTDPVCRGTPGPGVGVRGLQVSGERPPVTAAGATADRGRWQDPAT
jgi:hypothetical protein